MVCRASLSLPSAFRKEKKVPLDAFAQRPSCNPGTGLVWPGLPGSPVMSSYCRWKETWGPHCLKHSFKVIMSVSWRCGIWLYIVQVQNHLHPLSPSGSKKLSPRLVPWGEIIYGSLLLLGISKSSVLNCLGQSLARVISVLQINAATKGS